MKTSQPSDSATPMMTPANTPALSTARIAAIAIQKSTRATRRRRFISVTSIMPNTTASMIRAASTALGSSENNGANTSNVSTIRAPVANEASGVLAPDASLSELADRLVETGIPCNTPEPTLATPWATDSWSMLIR